jgi:hypothetical protein
LADESSITSQLIRADLGTEKVEQARKGKGYNTTVGNDKWARGQLLFYISGFGEEKLVENIARNFPSVAKKINEADLEIVKANAYQAGENSDLSAEVKATYDVNFKVPGDFRKAKYDARTQTLWLRRDSRDIIANIIIHKRPYTSKEQLTKNGIKTILNEVGKIVSTPQPNTYMRINDEDLPLFAETITLHNRFTVQAKGIWEIENDFMGGPFVSNLILNSDKGELLLVDGFILAPQEDKRNHMQELEYIISEVAF